MTLLEKLTRYIQKQRKGLGKRPVPVRREAQEDLEKQTSAVHVPPRPGLIPVVVRYQREGQPVESIRYIRPRAGRPLKQERSEEEQKIRDIQHETEMEAKRQQEEYGELQIPWHEKEGVKVEETRAGTKYQGKGITFEVASAGTEYVIRENGQVRGIVPKERDAEKYVQRRFEEINGLGNSFKALHRL